MFTISILGATQNHMPLKYRWSIKKINIMRVVYLRNILCTMWAWGFFCFFRNKMNNSIPWGATCDFVLECKSKTLKDLSFMKNVNEWEILGDPRFMYSNEAIPFIYLGGHRFDVDVTWCFPWYYPHKGSTCTPQLKLYTHAIGWPHGGVVLEKLLS